MQYFSTIVVGIMTAFALVGIIDQLFLKNRLGLGAEFQRGIEMIGPLCLAIVGIIALVPEMKWGIEHTLTPLYRTLPTRANAVIIPTCRIGRDRPADRSMGGHRIRLHDGCHHSIHDPRRSCGNR